MAFNLILSGFACASVLSAIPTLEETRSTVDKWVETRQLISRTKTDWQADKELLEQSIALFDRELKGVEEAMGKVDTSSAQVGKEREQAENAIKASLEALEKAKSIAGEYEGRVRRFTPRLPVPLQDLLKPLLNRLPENSVETKAAATERAQVIVGILNEVDKFNNSVSIFSEKRKNQKGEEIAVQTVYVGLGAAYFVSDAGDFAGVGTPGANGWEWSIKPELAKAVHDAVKIYRNEGTARFIALPATIK